MIYDLIYIEADDRYAAMPRGDGGTEGLKAIYERTQLGSSGLYGSIPIERADVECLINSALLEGEE